MKYKIIDKIPEELKHFEIGDNYFELFDENGSYGFACLNFTYKPYAIFHIWMIRWTHNILKSLKYEYWPACIAMCRENECDFICINKKGNAEENKIWIKFIRKFGFDEIASYTSSYQYLGE